MKLLISGYKKYYYKIIFRIAKSLYTETIHFKPFIYKINVQF